MFARINIEIFDDAPIGPQVLANPNPDPDQVILAEELRRLGREYCEGLKVRRYYLGKEARGYLEHPPVAALIRERGPGVLPVTVVNGHVFKTGAYPKYGEIEAVDYDYAVSAWERALVGMK